jgi:hypothetical protein
MKNRIKKIGTALTILTFGLICGIGGYELRSSTDSASSVLPISKGGTGGKTANDAASNILGSDFENYDGVLPLAKGGVGVDATNRDGKIQAQRNLGIENQTYTYQRSTDNTGLWLKVASVKYDTSTGGRGNQTVLITGTTSYAYRMASYILSVSGREPSQELVSLTSFNCNRQAFYANVNDRRDYYILSDGYANKTTVSVLSNDDINPAFTTNYIPYAEKPTGAVTFNAKCPVYQ